MRWRGLLWEYSFFQFLRRLGLSVPEHKEVHVGGVAMEIAEEKDGARLDCLFHHQFGVEVDGVGLARGGDPLPVQVLPDQGAPVVAHYNAIWVQHGNDLKYECVSQVLGLLIVANEILNNPLHHIRSLCFSRVHSRCQYYGLPQGNVLWVRVEICYYEHFAVIAS